MIYSLPGIPGTACLNPCQALFLGSFISSIAACSPYKPPSTIFAVARSVSIVPPHDSVPISKLGFFNRLVAESIILPKFSTSAEAAASAL